MRSSEIEAFYKLQSKFYDATRWAFLFNRKRAVEYLDVHPGDTVIDFACGTGLNMRHILKTKNLKVLGIDYSESMLKIARKKYPSVEFIRDDISTHVFEEKADKVISTYGISMVDEWERSLINMKNTLKGDGTLVILDFHPWGDGIMKKLFYPLFRWWLGLHGVDPEKKITFFLNEHFRLVEEKKFHGGYDAIIVAKYPRATNG